MFSIKRFHCFKLIIIIGVVTALLSQGCSSNGSVNTSEVLVNSEEMYSYESKEKLDIDHWSIFTEEYLTELRETYNLEELVSGCSSDLEKVVAVSDWVTNLWVHDGYNIPEDEDPLYILKQVTENGAKYRCVEYGIVTTGCLTSLGITARTLHLKTKDCQTRREGAGHVVTEVYLNDLDKWIMVDSQFGTIPMLGSVPMNAVEFAVALEEELEELDVLWVSDKEASTTEYDVDESYYQWIKEYLYYLDTEYYVDTKYGVEPISIMLVPKGAMEPTIFQNKYPISMDYYIKSVIDFYPKCEF